MNYGIPRRSTREAFAYHFGMSSRAWIAPRAWSRSLGVWLLFLVLAVVHTWPLASAPARLSRNDNADTVLNEWTLAWVARHVTHEPTRVFDANIFAPERGTLAYSEYLIPQAVAAAPLFWVGASPVLVYNLLLLAGLALTGWAGCLVVRRWTGDMWAGIVSGTLLTFNAHILTRLPHLQVVYGAFLPVALLAWDALLRHPRRRDAVTLSVALWLQGLTSYYGLVMAVLALGVTGLARVREWWGVAAGRRLRYVTLSALAVLLLLSPFLWGYWRVGTVRSLEEVSHFVATWRDWITTPAHLHYDLWSQPYFSSAALFPGVTALVLAAAAVATPAVRRQPRAQMLMALAVVGVALSFGPAWPGYAWLYRLFVPLQGIRNVARLGYLTTVASALLAGLALAHLRSRWRAARWLPVASVAVVIVANLDGFAAPIDYVEWTPPSAAVSILRHTSGTVAVIPFYGPERVFRNADYLLESTRHWRPMLNGYSGLTPESYVRHAAQFASFPRADALEALRAAGVTHMIVHEAALSDWADAQTVRAVRESTGLRLLARDQDVAVYALRP